MWKCRLKCRQLYFIVDRNEFTVDQQRNIHDCLWQRGFPSWFFYCARSFFFLRSFRTHLCIREGRANSYETLVKNGPLFIEFTIFHVSSRRDFYPPREPIRFSKLRLTWYALRFMRISYGTHWGVERRGTLHYNYSVKKFKSLNTVCRTTIPTILKLRGTRIRLCKRGESRLMCDNCICNIKACYRNKPFYGTLKHVCEHWILIKIFFYLHSFRWIGNLKCYLWIEVKDVHVSEEITILVRNYFFQIINLDENS